MQETKVLFVCIHNSARSQMAEAFLKQLGGETVQVESAGFEPGAINPLAIDVMKEAGIDISNNQTSSVFQFFKEGRLYDYVITVCDEGAAQRCPLFPGISRRLQWSFPDPSTFTGTPEENLAAARGVRDQIQDKVRRFLQEIQS